MQTVIIFDQVDADLKFVVLDGDYRHLNGIYINTYIQATKLRKEHEKKQDELNNLLFDETTGEMKVPTSREFPVQAVRDGAEVIVAGFLP